MLEPSDFGEEGNFLDEWMNVLVKISVHKSTFNS